MTTPVERLSRVIDATGALVAGVRDDQWAAATPCTEWSVRDLVNHVVEGSWRWAAIVGGHAPSSSPGDLLGDDPAAAYRKGAAALLAAFDRPGVFEEEFDTPIGAAPGAVVVQLRTVEILVHGWDLARATGQTTAFPDDAAEQALAFTQGSFDKVTPGRLPFGASRPVSDGAPAIDRLAALLGRSVG